MIRQLRVIGDGQTDVDYMEPKPFKLCNTATDISIIDEVWRHFSATLNGQHQCHY